MQNENKTQAPAMMGSAPGAGSPEGLTVRNAMDLVGALMSLHDIERRLDSGAWKLIAALTKDRRHFPKAVEIGQVHTDVALLQINGVTSKALEIRTGADGSYSVYADNYDAHGFPGRIIIELGHPVTAEEEENDQVLATPTITSTDT